MNSNIFTVKVISGNTLYNKKYYRTIVIYTTGVAECHLSFSYKEHTDFMRRLAHKNHKARISAKKGS